MGFEKSVSRRDAETQRNKEKKKRKIKKKNSGRLVLEKIFQCSKKSNNEILCVVASLRESFLVRYISRFVF